MTVCKICSVEDNIQYQCNYCGSVFCSDHRLPEKHDCPALVIFKEVDTSWFRDERDIAELESDDVDVSDEVIEEIKDAPKMETRSQAVHDQKTREVIGMLSSTAEVDDETEDIVVDSESAYETIEPGTVGTSIEPDYDSSPGMNPDGSLKRDGMSDLVETPSSDEDEDGLSPFARLLFMLLVLAVVAVGVFFVVL